MLAARWALLGLLCQVRKVFFLVEQPVSSVAHHLPYMEALLTPGKFMMGFPSGLYQRLCLDIEYLIGCFT